MVFSIIINDLSVRFESSVILDSVEFKVERGEIFGVLGPNGSGKTTLLKCIARSLKPTTGEVIVLGRPANQYTEAEYSKIVSAMLPNWPGGFSMKAYEIVLMGCRNRSRNFWWEDEADLKVAEDALKILGAIDFFDRDFDTLSSGEQRKVLIAKSLAQKTEIILLDEPIAYLDIKHQLEVMEVLQTLVGLGKTVLVSLHELELATRYCDRILVLNHGRVAAEGEPKYILTKDLLREVYGVEADVVWNDEYNHPLIIPKTKKAPKEAIFCLK